MLNKKLLLFDLDGVLVSTKELHFDAFNEALNKNSLESLTFVNHLNIYDGLSTKQKIKEYSKRNNICFSEEDENKIWEDKQKITAKLITQHSFFDRNIFDTFDKLKKDGYIICVCTNSIRETTEEILKSLSIIKLINRFYCNEDVKTPKPYPEIYWKPMIDFSVYPRDSYIFEDSPYGIMAAKETGANVVFIKSPKDIKYDFIIKNIKEMKSKPYLDINVLIPMAGNGSRFEKAGYTFPKPLIDVRGKPMIQRVVENFGFDANFIFIVKKEHREKYALDIMLKLIAPNCKVIDVDKTTEGAACTTMLAKEYIDNDKELIMSNCDQYIDTDIIQFLYSARNKNVDSSFLCFEGTHPKFSFAKVDDNGFILEVAEKRPISNIANTGLYYWKRGSDFIKYTERMIEKNIRVNGEFYSAPAANEAIKDGKRINAQILQSDKMWCLGDPESLTNYLTNFHETNRS